MRRVDNIWIVAIILKNGNCVVVKVVWKNLHCVTAKITSVVSIDKINKSFNWFKHRALHVEHTGNPLIKVNVTFEDMLAVVPNLLLTDS